MSWDSLVVASTPDNQKNQLTATAPFDTAHLAALGAVQGSLQAATTLDVTPEVCLR